MPRLWRVETNESYFTYLSEYLDTWGGQVVIEELLIAAITVVALTGNIVMLVVTWRQPRPLAVVNLLLASQCTSDLLIVLTNPLLMVTRVTRDWVLGDVPCRLLNYLQYASASTSVWTMMSLALDRYVAVCSHRAAANPIKRHVLKVICATWVMGLGWFSPFLIGWSTHSLRQDGVTYTWCYLVWPEGLHGLTFVVTSGVLVLALPLLIIVVCYTCVLLTVRRSSRRVKHTSVKQPSRSGEQRRSLEKKLLKMLLISVTLFVFMWFPFFAFTVAILFEPETTSTQYLFFLLLPVSNTAINPVLILYFNPNYRQSVTKLLSPYCGRCCQPGEDASVVSDSATHTARKIGGNTPQQQAPAPQDARENPESVV
nr:hypothetical protein BaRGS_013580 [Batillaria attramentaria]